MVLILIEHICLTGNTLVKRVGRRVNGMHRLERWVVEMGWSWCCLCLESVRCLRGMIEVCLS